MENKEYLAKALRTFNSKDELTNLLHMSLGLVTEAAEIADVLKKHIAYGREIDVVNLKEELGDVMWFTYVFCHVLNLDPGDVMHTNIAKLAARYPESYSDFNALNRDLETERKVLENNE